MHTLTELMHTIFRLATGGLLMVHGYAHWSGAMSSSHFHTDPLCLCSANFTPLHMGQTLVITMMGLLIFLGIRTRYIAAFAAVFIAAHAAACVASGNALPTFQASFTMLLIPVLLLVVLGGGESALYRRGWSKIPL